MYTLTRLPSASQHISPPSNRFGAIKNRKIALEAANKSKTPSSEVLKDARKSLASRKKELLNLPFLNGITCSLVMLFGGLNMLLTHAQKQEVQTFRENYSVEERNPSYLSHLQSLHNRAPLLAFPLFALVALLLGGTVQCNLKALKEMREGIDETEALEAFLTTRADTEPLHQEMITPLERHIEAQVSTMAQTMKEEAARQPGVAYELGIVFGPEKSSPSVETLTQLFHYLTSAFIREQQQQLVLGEKPQPVTRSEYLIKMATLLEFSQLRGDPFEILREDVGEPHATKTGMPHALEPRLFKLLALAESRIRTRAEQWAKAARARTAFMEEIQQLREQLAEQQKENRPTTQAQAQAVQRLHEKLHTVTHRPDPPIFLPEEVAALGLALPLEALSQREAAGAENVQEEEEAVSLAPSQGDELLAALTRMDEALGRIEGHYEKALKILKTMR